MKLNYIPIKSSRMMVLSLKLRSLLLIGVMALSGTLFAQDESQESTPLNQISGTVVDAKSGEPVPAAQIQALSSKTAATTDENGQFEIELASPNDVLLIKAFDYYPREVAIQGSEQVEVELYSDIFTNLYADEQDLTGSIKSSYSTRANNGIDEMGLPFMSSPDKLIQTYLGGELRTAGQSGVTGLNTTMFIRGLNSINLSSQPLIVVDGVIWNDEQRVSSLHDGFSMNSLFDIDINDIENITIIKDGTSFYGSKGGNGVILINTIRGRDVATKISLKLMGGVTEMPTSLPMMNGDQFRIYATDLLGTTSFTPQQIADLPYLNDDPEAISYSTYHNTTNWDNEVYQQSRSQGLHLSVNGGDEKALYAFSVGYLGNFGVIQATSMQRLNTRFNADFSMTDKISTVLNVGFTDMDWYRLDDGVNFYTSPSYLAMIKPQFLNPYSFTNTGAITANPEDSDIFDISNPNGLIQTSLNTNKHFRLNMGIKPSIQINPNLNLSTFFDYSLEKAKETFYSPIVGVADRRIEGMGIAENTIKAQDMRAINIFSDTRVTYKNQFDGIHHINLNAGFRYMIHNLEADYAEGHNSGSDQQRYLRADWDYKFTYGINDQIKSISNYANVDYNYDNRYFASLALAIDGSSRFGAETQGGVNIFGHSFGVFPSLNAAWLLSSESFMSSASFVDQLKLRAAFGLAGNDALDPYAWTGYFGSTQYMYRANGIVIQNIGNSNIQWESTSKLSLGVDANLLNDRIAVNLDLYNNKTTDLLLLKSLPDLAGPGYYWENGGSLTNTGLEFSTIVKLLNLKNLKWEAGASLGHYTNNITFLPGGDVITQIYDGEILSSENNPAGLFYGYKTEGVFATQAEAEAANLKIVDENGMEHFFGAGDIHFQEHPDYVDGIIDENDRQVIGDPNPDLYGSFNSKITFGNLTFEAWFTYSYGNDVYNYLRAKLESGDDFINQTTAMLNRWSYEGQETGQPKVVYGDPMGNARFSDRWIEDGSYLKLKNLSLNYRIPISGKAIEDINIWVAAANLWTLTSYLGRDPEVSAQRAVLYQGIDTGLVPNTRSFFAGLKLNL